MEIKHVRYCITGIGLRTYWAQITKLLTDAGMTWHQIRDCQTYQDALQQYKSHLESCEICRSENLFTGVEHNVKLDSH